MPRRLRSPSAADAHAVLDVIQARDVADVGAPDFTLEDLEADWSRPGMALEHDARVAVARARGIRGYAILLGDDACVCVHPDAEGEGIGGALALYESAGMRTVWEA